MSVDRLSDERMSDERIWKFIIDDVPTLPAGVNLDAIAALSGDVQQCNRVLEALGCPPITSEKFDSIQLEIDQRMNRPPTFTVAKGLDDFFNP